MLATVFGSRGGVKSVSSATTGPTAPSFTTVSTFSSAQHSRTDVMQGGFVCHVRVTCVPHLCSSFARPF